MCSPSKLAFGHNLQKLLRSKLHTASPPSESIRTPQRGCRTFPAATIATSAWNVARALEDRPSWRSWRHTWRTRSLQKKHHVKIDNTTALSHPTQVWSDGVIMTRWLTAETTSQMQTSVEWIYFWQWKTDISLMQLLQKSTNANINLKHNAKSLTQTQTQKGTGTDNNLTHPRASETGQPHVKDWKQKMQ